ncbi:MAG TPA: ATP-binding cassette domain-containing protein [Mycobacteriales bacterium]|nr:ATP-binding cassette domain-containing protein [Mycobacteriales bacterium]
MSAGVSPAPRRWGGGRIAFDKRFVRRGGIAIGSLVGLWVLLDFVLPHVITTSQTSTGHWQTPFPVVALGLISGASYGMLAAGLVLIYRANRIINFAHGEVGAFGASVFAIEVSRWHIPYWAAFVPALAAAGLVGVLIENNVIRPLRNRPFVMSVVATLIAGQGIAGFAQLINSRSANVGTVIPQPAGIPSFNIGALLVTPSYTAILIIAPVAVGAIGLFLKLTRIGRGIRSAADNADAARMAGIPVNAMSAIAWAIAGGLAALTAILTAPAGGLSSGDNFGPSLLLIALTGAVLARMRSLPQAMIGGLALGVLEQLLTWNSANPGLVEMARFVVIVVALLIQRQPVGRSEDKGSWAVIQSVQPLPAAVRRLPSVQVLEKAPWVVLVTVLAVMPVLIDNGHSIELSITFAVAITALALGVVTGLGGQLSLGQFAISAIGAYASFEISRRTGNFIESFAYAGAAGAALSVLLGLPALKARGLMFAVSTLAFALVVPDYLLGQSWLLGQGRIPGRPIIDGHRLSSGHSYYYVALATLLIALLFARNVRRGGLGRRLVAVRDNEDAARAFSVSGRWTKVQCYAIAGALTGLAGAMYGHALSLIGSDGFPVTQSISAVEIAIVGGLGALSGPLFGALVVQGPTYFTVGLLGNLLLTNFYLAVVLWLPAGLVQLPLSLRNRVAAWLAGRAGVDFAAAVAAERGIVEATGSRGDLPDFARPAHRRITGAGVLLEVTNLSKSFGGIHAVRGLSFDVRAGETLGLIGPNGAGKTTTFELVAGFVRADAGSVRFRGEDITRRTPEARARLGLIRSFQDAALFPTLTVAECVALSLERSAPTSVALNALGVTRGERRKRAQADELLEWMGLSRFRASTIGELSTGTRRITEIACLVALQPELLLLDEPSSGVAQRETEALGELLARLRSELSLTMVIIEHDMPLVMGLSDRVLCMADGEQIALGTPERVQSDPAVVTAYLGGDVAAASATAGEAVA